MRQTRHRPDYSCIEPQRRNDAKKSGIHVIVPRNEHVFSNTPGVIVFQALRLCGVCIMRMKYWKILQFQTQAFRGILIWDAFRALLESPYFWGNFQLLIRILHCIQEIFHRKYLTYIISTSYWNYTPFQVHWQRNETNECSGLNFDDRGLQYLIWQK